MRPEGKTSPEELIAAAHAGCFAMALGSVLAGRGTPPERLDVSVRVTVETSGIPKITSSDLDVHGVVLRSDPTAFAQASHEAEQNPWSREPSKAMSRSGCTPHSTSAPAPRPPREAELER